MTLILDVAPVPPLSWSSDVPSDDVLPLFQPGAQLAQALGAMLNPPGVRDAPGNRAEGARLLYTAWQRHCFGLTVPRGMVLTARQAPGGLIALHGETPLWDSPLHDGRKVREHVTLFFYAPSHAVTAYGETIDLFEFGQPSIVHLATMESV